MLHFFITFSRGDLIPESSLSKFLATFPKWLYVYEYGSSGSNLHYHAIVGMEAPALRTDKITEKARSGVYSQASLNKVDLESGTLRFLVQTKSCSSKAGGWQKLYAEYLSKETHNKDFKYLKKSDNWDTKELENIYKTYKITGLLRRSVILTLKNAPLMIKNFVEEQEADYKDLSTKHWLLLMMKHDYICHHLFDDNQLTKIDIGFQALMGAPMYDIQLRKKNHIKTDEVVLPYIFSD